MIKLDASKGGFAGGDAVVGGAGVVIGNSDPSCENMNKLDAFQWQLGSVDVRVVKENECKTTLTAMYCHPLLTLTSKASSSII